MIFNRVILRVIVIIVIISILYFLTSCSLTNDVKDDVNKITDQITEKIKDTNTIIQDSCSHYFEISFGGMQPEDLEILNCHYWRSAHWTLEHEYYFEFAPNQMFLEDLIYFDDSLMLANDSPQISGKPEWFIPKSREAYKTWISKKEFDDFQVHQDIQTGNIFVHGSQF